MRATVVPLIDWRRMPPEFGIEEFKLALAFRRYGKLKMLRCVPATAITV
jgi:hypothetical protein